MDNENLDTLRSKIKNLLQDFFNDIEQVDNELLETVPDVYDLLLCEYTDKICDVVIDESIKKQMSLLLLIKDGKKKL